jgi:Peptidase S46
MNLKNNKLLKASFFLLVLFSSFLNAQVSDEITAESDIFDTGKMWTFDFPPTQYLNETYGFAPDDEWYDDVRLSALRIPGCTASFVSENGLIMTNNHCSHRHRDNVQKRGENLIENGFYAKTLKDERRVPNMYAEQLAFIVDVTDELNKAIDEAETNEEKIKNKESKIRELIEHYNEETGLKCQFVSLFNGGKFSIYGYKRFNDVRLVYVPELSVAEFGGDYDNFTYPRYDLDCAFYRVYDNEGNPINSEHFFKFSENGVQKDEVIFSVGNPGKTNRLYTVSQLEYYRDITYRNKAFMYDEYYNLLEQMKYEFPEMAEDFEKTRTKIGNGQKVFHYIQAGLMDPYLIARKRDFENKIRATVSEDPQLNKKYGHIWASIMDLRNELKPIESKLAAYRPYRFFGTEYFKIAKDILYYAKQMKLSEEDRLPRFKNVDMDSLKNSLYPEQFDNISELGKLQAQLDFIRLNLGNDDELVKKLCGSLQGREAVDRVLEKSTLSDKKSALELINKEPDEILNSDDPFIFYVANTEYQISDLSKRVKEISDTESVLVNMLGKVLFDIYSTEIPPDANFTLRLSDGVLASFDYNGTVAIEKTTFYGMYDRYYGSDKTYPWHLPERWAEPPADLDLSTVYNFISTNDIVGGSSGSAVINKEAEVVGLAFDGNIESIVGDFIYLPEDNRMVSVASQAILEALEKVYNAERIVEELKTGKIAN